MKIIQTFKYKLSYIIGYIYSKIHITHAKLSEIGAYERIYTYFIDDIILTGIMIWIGLFPILSWLGLHNSFIYFVCYGFIWSIFVETISRVRR